MSAAHTHSSFDGTLTDAAPATHGPGTVVDRSVEAMYEAFPYPPPYSDEAFLHDIRAGERGLSFGPNEAFHSFFPNRASTAPLDVLVAGCGTTIGVATAASLPDARVVAIDISQPALDMSAHSADAAGVSNIEHVRLPIEAVHTLNRSFDLIMCTGVLHHLADPAAGLRALGGALRPGGSIGVMVYGQHGRAGVYLLQELFRLLELEPTETDARRVQSLVQHLPKSHPIHAMGLHLDRQPYPLAELTDMLLHPRDRAYTVHDVRQLIAQAGMKFHRWLGQSLYHVEASPFSEAGAHEQARALDEWDQYRALELVRGNMHQHSFVVTHQDRQTPSELFGGTKILDAVPTLHRNLKLEREGDELVMRNEALWRPLCIRAEVRSMVTLLKTIDGRSTVREILAGDPVAAADPATYIRAAGVFWYLYRCDIIDLGLRSASAGG